MRRLHLVPAEVRAPPAARCGRQLVDLLPFVLADVADPQIAVGAIEAEAPRVADAVEPHLRPPALAVGERVVGRNAVLLAARRVGGVDPQDLAQQRLGVLPVALGIAAAAAVAECDVQVAVGPELHLPAVVVGERVLDRQQLAVRPGVDVVSGHRVRGDAGIAARRQAVVHVERAAVVGELDVEQSPLPVGNHVGADVEDGIADLVCPVGPCARDRDRPDPPGAFGDVHRRRAGTDHEGGRGVHLRHGRGRDLDPVERGLGGRGGRRIARRWLTLGGRALGRGHAGRASVVVVHTPPTPVPPGRPPAPPRLRASWAGTVRAISARCGSGPPASPSRPGCPAG